MSTQSKRFSVLVLNQISQQGLRRLQDRHLRG